MDNGQRIDTLVIWRFLIKSIKFFVFNWYLYVYFYIYLCIRFTYKIQGKLILEKTLDEKCQMTSSFWETRLKVGLGQCKNCGSNYWTRFNFKILLLMMLMEIGSEDFSSVLKGKLTNWWNVCIALAIKFLIDWLFF